MSKFVATNRYSEVYIYNKLPNGDIQTLEFLGYRLKNTGRIVNPHASKVKQLSDGELS